jgi:hypothetical protein
MIISDKNNLYYRPGTLEKLTRELGLEGAGMYLTYKAFAYDNPNGVEEMILVKSSSDGVEANKTYINKLIEKGYLRKNEKD